VARLCEPDTDRYLATGGRLALLQVELWRGRLCCQAQDLAPELRDHFRQQRRPSLRHEAL
jgi:hypothetical protein